MGDHYTPIKELIQAWVAKYSIFIIYIMIGIAVQIGMYDKSQKLTRWQRFWRALVSLCAGAIASIACSSWGWEKIAMFLVPCTTLIGQSLFEYIIKKWPSFADFWIDKFTKTNGK